MMIKVLVVDDHELVRRGIRSVLAAEPTLTICGEATDGLDATEKALKTRPDIVVMDISMPRMNGLQAAQEIKRLLPETEIVIISQHEIPEMVTQAFRAGARAYVAKSSISRDLLAAITKVNRVEPTVEVVGPASTHSSMDARETLFQGDNIEKALRESEERFRSAMSSMAEGLYTLDTQGLVTYVNPSAESMFGWTSAELLGKRMHDVTHYKYPDGTPFPANDCPGLQVVQRGIDLREHEDLFIRKNGSWLPVVFSASPLKINGEISGVVVCFRDDSQRRAAEEATRLRAAIVDFSTDAIISKNLDGVITSWNQGAVQMFGYSPAEAVGQHITLIIPRNRLDEEVKILQKLKRGERVEHFETMRIRKDGQQLDVSLTISPLKNAKGLIVGASKVARDITERKQSERALLKSEERLHRLTEDLESQVSVRTLELEQRNAEVFKQTEQLRELSNRLLKTQDEERRRIARELHDGVGQLLAALSMNFSVLVNEKSKLSPDASRSLDENISLIEEASKEIRTMSHLLHPPLLDEVGLESALRWYVDGYAERSKIDVQMNLAPGFSDGLPRDVALALFRVVQECLTNVHRHSGSQTASVGIDRSRDGIILQVKDDGKGISEDIKSKISSGEGAGVGLRGIRERLREFDGRLEIHSDETGTWIVANLPFSDANSNDTGTEANARDKGQLTLPKTLDVSKDEPATILCIDDETAGLLPRRLLLESAGHRVIEASSGEEGIRIFRSEKIDAVILDYWMSGMKGTAVAWELKRIKPDVPIIVLSGVSELPGEAAGLVDQWLVKGSQRAEQLLNSINTLLERRPA